MECIRSRERVAQPGSLRSIAQEASSFRETADLQRVIVRSQGHPAPPSGCILLRVYRPRRLCACSTHNSSVPSLQALGTWQPRL